MAARRFKGKSDVPVVGLISIAQGMLVAECLSFRRAGSKLGTPHSVVGRRIRALEDDLGVSLFERHAGRVQPTVAGVRFFAQCRGPLQQLDFAVKTAGAAGRGAVGRLNIGILSSMAAGFLRELVRTYHERQPDVLVHLLEGASVEQIALVRKGQLDVAFVLGTPDLPHCEVTRL
jgi:DNA-binding transcriptional LysR family regulator